MRYDTEEEFSIINDLYRNELRLIGSGQLPHEKEKAPKRLYASLNPVELKRAIDTKLDRLYKSYHSKN